MVSWDCGAWLKIAIPNVSDSFFFHSKKFIKFSLIHLPDSALVVSDTTMDALGLTFIHKGLHRLSVLQFNLIKTLHGCIKGVWIIIFLAALEMQESGHSFLEFINKRLARFIRPSWVQVVRADVALATLRNRILSGQLMLDAVHRINEKLLLVRLKIKY